MKQSGYYERFDWLKDIYRKIHGNTDYSFECFCFFIKEINFFYRKDVTTPVEECFSFCPNGKR